MSLRNVIPSIPEGGPKRTQLEEDLRRMRYAGLLERLWGLKHKAIMQELILMERPTVFDGTIRGLPQMWTSKIWRDVYNFPEGGEDLAHRMDVFIEKRFNNQVDPKDGYSVRDCRNARQRRVLEFLVPVIHPDKPTRVTITIGNTIFGALDGGRPVDWGVVFRDLAQKVHAFVGYSGDMVNKAHLYDESMRKPEVVPRPKVIRCLVNYNLKMEKLFKELQALLQPGEQREEAGPSQ